METAGTVGQFLIQAGAGSNTGSEILGATFWDVDQISYENFERMKQFGILSNKKVVSVGGSNGTFFFVPAPLDLAFAIWQIKWAQKLPPFTYRISPEILSAPKCDIFYKLWKYELRISMADRKIFVPDFFAGWIEIPLAMNNFEVPGAMTIRWKLHVEEEKLREVVMLYNGRVYLPKELKS